MLEYDASHVTSNHRTTASLLRHGIAQKSYQDRKATLVHQEDALRRRASLSRLVARFRSAMAFPLRAISGAVPRASDE